MSGRLARHIRSNVYGIAAVALALCAATAIAAPLPSDSVDSSSIVNGEVKKEDLALGSVRSAEVANGSIRSADVATNTLSDLQIDEGTLSSAVLQRSLDGEGCAEGLGLSSASPAGDVACGGPLAYMADPGGSEEACEDSACEAASLSVPAGKYVIFSTVGASQFAGAEEYGTVVCELRAGQDFDRGRYAWAPADVGAGVIFSTEGTMSMQVVHDFSQAGKARVLCERGPGEAEVYVDPRIVALRLGSFANGSIRP